MRHGKEGLFGDSIAELRRGLRVVRRRGPVHLRFWLVALIVGVAGGLAAVAFRRGIEALQRMVYTESDIHLHSVARDLPWFWILLVPILGGLVVGQILHRFTPDGRVRSVGDVIEGAALSDGRVEIRAGLASALASLVTLSTGGSSGREGPVVHLAGTLSTVACRWLHADGITGRDLLGCAVAAAVSASFNAPIAGTIFALEVVLRHFAMHAFAPIAIASVTGAVVSRMEYGNVTEFRLPEPGSLVFYVELPAFLILGLLCGVVAVVLMRGIFWAESVANDVQARTRMPRWLRPAVSGALLGLIAIWFPHIIGVGYETTARALMGDLTMGFAVGFAVVKCVAVAITFAGRMGGGVFSPAMMMGALTGLAFGYVATGLLPQVSGSETLYALAGMGAVAAAVLGAPISTTLIVFELTGDWQTGLAVMTSVSLSSALASRMVDRSFFLTQLERRGVRLAAGPQTYLLAMRRVSTVMKPAGHPRLPDPEELARLADQGASVDRQATLEAAMKMFEGQEGAVLAVTGPDASGGRVVLGGLRQIDALKAYARALAATAQEEHS